MAPAAEVHILPALPGLVNAVRDVPVRPHVADAPFGVETGLGLCPEAQAGPRYSWKDFTILDRVAAGWAPLCGTSIATPHITGLLTPLVQTDRFTRKQLVPALTATADRNTAYEDFEQGWRFIDGQALANWLEQHRLYGSCMTALTIGTWCVGCLAIFA